MEAHFGKVVVKGTPEEIAELLRVQAGEKEVEYVIVPQKRDAPETTRKPPLARDKDGFIVNELGIRTEPGTGVWVFG